MKDYARAFYASKEWRKLSRLYMESKHYLCERCGGVGSICHHRQYITPHNINDPSITLNMDNLECLCQDCHNREHTKRNTDNDSFDFDQSGNIVRSAKTFIVCGAPGSGKTTYVMENKSSNDIVFDMDYICSALVYANNVHDKHDCAIDAAMFLRDAFYDYIEQKRLKRGKAWIITAAADMAMLNLLAYRLDADIIMMNATLDDCIRNINQDPARTNKMFHIQLARKWYKAHEE